MRDRETGNMLRCFHLNTRSPESLRQTMFVASGVESAAFVDDAATALSYSNEGTAKDRSNLVRSSDIEVCYETSRNFIVSCFT